MNVQYTKADREEILGKWNNLLKKFREDNNKWENHTKREYVLQCLEVIELQIDSGILPLKLDDASSFLYKELLNQGIRISEGYYSEIVPDKYKRNYSKSSASEVKEPNWRKVAESETHLLEQNQFGHFRINGVDVSGFKKENENVDVEVTYESKIEVPQPPKITNETTKILKAIEECGSLLYRFGESLSKIYQDDESYRVIIDEVLKNRYDFYKEQYAILHNARNTIDERRKWGDYEKLLAKFLLDTGVTTAHLAKKMEYSSKFGSIGIDRNEDLLELWQFLRRCPSCKTDIAYLINEDISRYKAGKKLVILHPPGL